MKNSEIQSADLEALEHAIREHRPEQDFSEARKPLRRYVFSQLSKEQDGSISDAIAELAKTGAAAPDAAAVLLRCLSVDGVLPSGADANQVDRHLSATIEKGLPKLCSYLEVSDRSQTYQKIETFRSAHGVILGLLAPLKMRFDTIEGLLSMKTSILGALNHGAVKEYGKPFDINGVKGLIERLFHDFGLVAKANTNLLQDVEQCSMTIREGLSGDGIQKSFIYYEFALPMLHHAEAALSHFIESTRGRFLTKIKAKTNDNAPLPKHYPLYEEGRQIQVRVPMHNTGPGLAVGVSARFEIASDALALENETTLLGDVLPGDFSLILDLLVISPVKEFTLDLYVDWGIVGTNERQQEMASFKVVSQTEGVDWQTLEYWHPYSTEPAEGVRFVGRSESVKSLAGKLLRSPMEPFYITGQKRVGKTSLALASIAFAKDRSVNETLHSTYVLWGHIANLDPVLSMGELGRVIYEFIAEELPSHANAPAYNFNGSLSPIVKLADLAKKIAPDKKFVIVVDEFDEIHQELFLQGNLAETFFANLRAISTARNICLIFVGGENMPFVMERQGDKLNKFTRHNVDYFSRATEWADFLELVRQPTTGTITWRDEAISEIFNETNGNPFFANLVCSRILRDAIQRRDSDIGAEEVVTALEAEVQALDANSFAHLWHDGIFKAASEREIDIVRRRRVLVALARVSRKHLPLRIQTVLEAKGTAVLSEAEIIPVLTDFVRRGVLSESDGEYRFKLPVFERWLREEGLNSVQPDPVSEELALAVQAEEDAAFVTSEEVVSLANSWPTYQGRHVSSDDVKTWYQQVDDFRQQRLLFKILKGLKFVNESEIREKLEGIFAQVRKQLREFVRYSLADRRDDILITYLDGHGKSGEYFAGLFAEQNKLSVSNIASQDELPEKIKILKQLGKPISAVVVVDDVAASGKTLADSAELFLQEHGHILADHNCKFFLCSMYATREASDLILERLRKFADVDSDFRFGELIAESLYAFSPRNTIWQSAEELERAKALVTDLGSRIYKRQPLGYGGLGLLLAFPTTVPNNSLPIIHSPSKSRQKPWKPLLPRPTN